MKLKRSKIIIGSFLVLMLGVTFASAQVIQAMRGSVKQVDPGGSGQFGPCDGSDTDCQLRYEYWSETFSAEINKDVTGIPNFLANGDYRAANSVLANYPVSGLILGANWFMSWFGETDGGTADHIGYYAAMSQKVFFGENGNDLRFDCNAGCIPAPGVPGCRPIACYLPLGDISGHSVTRADGSVIANLGGLSPIPVTRSPLIPDGLTIHLEWDAATGRTHTDGAPDPFIGYRIWVAEAEEQVCELAPASTDYRLLAEVVGPPFPVSTSADIGLELLDPAAGAVRFAIQLLYESTTNPNDAFERRSGFTLPSGNRLEGLSANGNKIVLVPFVQDFRAIDGNGNRGLISWETPGICDIIDRFVIDVFKDPTGLGEPIPSQHATQTFEVPFDGSASYTVIDEKAGISGSKVQIYTIRVVLIDGTEIEIDEITYAHKGRTN